MASDELGELLEQAEDPTDVQVPACFSKEINVEKNRARQLLVPSRRARLDLSVSPPRVVQPDGMVIRLLCGTGDLRPDERALLAGSEGLKDPATALNHPGLVRWGGDLVPTPPAQARGSWGDSLRFTLADKSTGRKGLRLPQLGAVHGVLSYWTTGSTQPATVVMPTGTGKTETMVALLVAERPERLLVVVPSDVLRSQISAKLESFGVLQEFGVIDKKALRPVVGQLRHAFSTPEVAKSFAEQCNVIVTTPAALFASTPVVRKALLELCSHLFIDEAHHVEATTWRRIREAFEGKPIVQFTATPFREDGRRLAGRIVYTFPLRQAQKYEYFSRINYISVVDFRDPDRAIAATAIGRLRQDLASGQDHLLMARVKRIGRAQEVREIYMELAPDLAPVLLHSSLPAAERRLALDRIRSRASRIIVCVDMLGEGFDLPALKVAAVHDLHKSLGVTLQFIGRFVRPGQAIGEATVVTGRPEGDYDESLRQLFAEDPDWNHIIRDLSEAAVSSEREIGELEAAFGVLPEQVSLRNIEPKMSCVVYRTKCEAWRPHAINDLFGDGTLFTDPVAVNNHDHVAWFVVESRTPVRWGDLETVSDITYDLYVVYWDEKRQLLYINSSDTEGVHEGIARAVCGEGVDLISGDAVYRVMAEVKRLVPTNVGLLDVRNWSRRFSMHVGPDVIEGFPLAEAQTKMKTNIFAYGYENGMRVSVGGSLKGRIWSYRVASTLKHWTDWCDHVGSKLIDTQINVDEVMRGFIRPKVAETRPPLVALGLEWPWELFANVSEETRVDRAGSDWPLVDTELKISEFTDHGPIRFDVATPAWKASYTLEFVKGRVEFRAMGMEVEVVNRRGRMPLSEYLTQHGLSILFEQDAMVVPPGVLMKPDRNLPAFDPERLVVLDWSGINIRKESQGPKRDADSVQARVIKHVLEQGRWEIVIDDDGSGEIADIVAMRVDGQHLVVKLVHCKFSSEASAGGRIIDLYEVCGQAQKSTRWRRNIEFMFRRLIQRERKREREGRSGFIVGDGNTLYRLEERARQLKLDFSMVIAQPGLSKRAASKHQLDLLGATEVYLHEVAYSPLNVICAE